MIVKWKNSQLPRLWSMLTIHYRDGRVNVLCRLQSTVSRSTSASTVRESVTSFWYQVPAMVECRPAGVSAATVNWAVTPMSRGIWVGAAQDVDTVASTSPIQSFIASTSATVISRLISKQSTPVSPVRYKQYILVLLIIFILSLSWKEPEI